MFIAEDLAPKVVCRGQEGCRAGRLRQVTGAELDGLTFTHPLYDRTSLAVLADYVTLEQGTGAVHTAPGMAPTTT